MNAKRLAGLLTGLSCLLLALAPPFSAPLWARKDRGLAPIVLVHGFMGWGRDELHGYRYWGGTALDVQDFLNGKGYDVHTAAVGPISSNHDRACELFAQIRGGRVDYGADHARTFGHARYGKQFAGFHPAWSEARPVHLIGHSMGGQTVRVLVDLLERDAFAVGSSGRWIRSVSTLSSPHRGTTLVDGVEGITGGMAEVYASWLMAVTGGKLDLLHYDFDLEAWGLEKGKDESMQAFLDRVRKTLGHTKDVSSWDLSLPGARELNRRILTHPEVYYFSYGNEETFRIPGTHRWIGQPTITPALHGPALFMGSHEPMDVPDFRAWGENDGVVNTVSMLGPETAEIRIWKDEPETVLPGVWNYVGCTANRDHLKVVGHFQDPLLTGRWLKPFYLAMVERIARLP